MIRSGSRRLHANNFSYILKLEHNPIEFVGIVWNAPNGIFELFFGEETIFSGRGTPFHFRSCSPLTFVGWLMIVNIIIGDDHNPQKPTKKHQIGSGQLVLLLYFEKFRLLSKLLPHAIDRLTDCWLVRWTTSVILITLCRTLFFFFNANKFHQHYKLLPWTNLRTTKSSRSGADLIRRLSIV